MSNRPRSYRTALAATVALTALAACGSSSKSTTSTTKAGSSTTATSTTTGGALSASSFTTDFAAMKQLSAVVKKGKGNIAVLLPDTATSARYTAFDDPYLRKAFDAAGLPTANYTVENAQGSAATQQTQAEAAITKGATVLVLDPLDSGSGAAIEANAKAKGVAVVDYDRLVKGGSAGRIYVSFDNVAVGKKIGEGFVQCVTDWAVKSPKVLLMDGDPTDNNATLFAKGYNSVLDPKFTANEYTKVAEPGGTWDNQKALTLFEQQFTAHPEINAVVAANDGLGGSVISALKTRSVKSKTVPVTGQDATAAGLQNILAGYQCGTVYKPIYLEAQAAAAVALYLRAGETPPEGLTNGTTHDDTANTDISSVLLVPLWVNEKNVAGTVIKDGFVKSADVCTTELKAACLAADIT
jgi:D-xylose transport system substrate-binding protein